MRMSSRRYGVDLSIAASVHGNLQAGREVPVLEQASTPVGHTPSHFSFQHAVVLLDLRIDRAHAGANLFKPLPKLTRQTLWGRLGRLVREDHLARRQGRDWRIDA